MKMSKNFERMAQVYKYFAKDKMLDYSDDAKLAQFLTESYGRGSGTVAANNGYAIGKRLLDITVANWLEDLDSELLFAHELYLQYPKWFVDKIIPKWRRLTDNEIQDVENKVGYLYGRVDFDDLDSGDKQYYFDRLNIQVLHECLT